MRTTSRRLIVAIVALTTLAACSSSTNGNGSGGGSGGNGNADAIIQQLDALPTTELTNDEVAGLLWMREEEKLARDVYDEMAARWDLQIFENISTSEQTHMDAVLALLDRHGLADPAAGMAPGEFTNTELQALYDTLVEQGSNSATEALKVGVAIEELDIADLQARQTDTADIGLVYDHLETGSEHHLDAFNRQLG
ncbi:MAG: DUF2202 domain-containing protein [Ilumatobacteraceae bacterium]